LPGSAFAAAGNGNGTPQAGNGVQVQNQNCIANCSGIPAEIGSSYDTLFPVTVHADLLQVYHNLQSASFSQHLPAFQACD
jgi:hypothetical protein